MFRIVGVIFTMIGVDLRIVGVMFRIAGVIFTMRGVLLRIIGVMFRIIGVPRRLIIFRSTIVFTLLLYQ